MATTTATERITPLRTAPSEFHLETAADGSPVQVTTEHFRQGEHFYRITWRGNAEPVVETEDAPTTETPNP